MKPVEIAMNEVYREQLKEGKRFQFWGNGYCVVCNRHCLRHIRFGNKRIVSIHEECEPLWKKWKGNQLVRVIE